MSLAKRIQMRLNELDMSQRELADKIEMSQPAVHKLVSGQSSSTRKLIEIAQALHCDAEWLKTGSTSSFSHNDNQITVTRNYDVQVLDIELSAGFGCNGDSEAILETIPIPERLLEEFKVSPQNARIVTVRGDSMETTLRNGEKVVVDISDKRLSSDSIFAFMFDDDLKVKRFVKQFDANWLIKSDNNMDPAYRDQVISPHNLDQLRVIGRIAGILARKL